MAFQRQGTLIKLLATPIPYGEIPINRIVVRRYD